MKSSVLGLLLSLLVLFSCAHTENKPDENEVVKHVLSVNQVGYLPGEEKYFITNSEDKKFYIKDSTDETLFEGDIVLRSEEDKATGQTLYKGDFTSFDQLGDFYIETEGGLKSYNFKVDSSVFENVRDVAVKSFYYQRSGIDLKEEHAGALARSAGHTEELEYHDSSPITGTKDVSGGWYDAGDYGRYITPASVSLGIMLIGYENYPEKFDSDSVNIPESGNGVSDFLDEMRFELEWMLKMQYTEEGDFKGALPYMVNSTGYAWGLPANSSHEQFIYDFSSVATANFTAIMAMSYRLYKDVDKAFADRCLEGAKLAWSFLEKNGEYPEGGFQRPADTETGGYAYSASDNKIDSDDRLWAAIELFRSTGEVGYHQYYLDNFDELNSGWAMAWTDCTGYAKLQYLLSDAEGLNTEIKNKLTQDFLSYCNSFISRIDKDGYKSILGLYDYYWGSNGEVLMRSELLILAYELTGNKEYYNGALYQLNYILGLNINNISYVSGLGTEFPKEIHHVVLFATNFENYIPGLMAGGANRNLNGDYTLPKYYDNKTPPAMCYIDHRDSWASNENCILYNAPLVPVATYFAK